MSEAEALKIEENTHFKNGAYLAAITKYEAALALGADPELHLILLTNRLHAYNNLDDNDSIQAREDLLAFLRTKPVGEWKQLFSDHMLCEAFFQNYRSFQKQKNLEKASTMLRGCLSFEPKNKTVLAAISELEILGTQKIADGGIIRAGTATSLSSVECCVHCLEEMGPLEECVQFHCNHSFHRGCAIKWWQQQALINPPLQYAGISGGDYKKLTCPSCRAKVYAPHDLSPSLSR
jgi:tetratricopeptide (TPR) repeat protein